MLLHLVRDMVGMPGHVDESEHVARGKPGIDEKRLTGIYQTVSRVADLCDFHSMQNLLVLYMPHYSGVMTQGKEDKEWIEATIWLHYNEHRRCSMNQKQLQYFVTVYQTQNIKTAADRLFVSRQGVSKVIRLLEEELGQPLFIRSIKGVMPTDYATILLPHAKRLLEEYDAIRGLHTLAAQSKSVVTIHALDHVLAYLGAPLINDFHEAYPSIILSIVDTTDAMALAALTAQQCNFAIVTGPLDETRFEGIPLFFSNYSVRMHKSHPLAKKTFLTYDDQDGQTIISKGRAYDCFRHNIDQHILVPGRQIHILAETADENIIRALLLENKAINIGYDYADALYPHPDIVSRRLKAENGGQMIYLVANLQVRTTKASRLFRDFLLEWIHKKNPTS